MRVDQDIAGLILAGGLSRRMFPGRSGANADAPGGGDKGLLEIAGKPMLAHVIERLRPQVGALAINANGDAGRFAAFGLPVVADTIEGFVGPLAGVLAGMRWAAGLDPAPRWVATVSADAPLLPGDLVERLRAGVETWFPPPLRARDSEGGNHGCIGSPSTPNPSPQGEEECRGPTSLHPIAIARSGGELHPVIGLWPVALADDLEAALRAGLRKVLHWTDRHGTVPVDFPFLEMAGRSVDPFFNANTPDELEEARGLLAKMGTDTIFGTQRGPRS